MMITPNNGDSSRLRIFFAPGLNSVLPALFKNNWRLPTSGKWKFIRRKGSSLKLWRKSCCRRAGNRRGMPPDRAPESVVGQKRKSRTTILMSVKRPKAKVSPSRFDVRYVPGTEVAGRRWHFRCFGHRWLPQLNTFSAISLSVAWSRSDLELPKLYPSSKPHGCRLTGTQPLPCRELSQIGGWIRLVS